MKRWILITFLWLMSLGMVFVGLWALRVQAAPGAGMIVVDTVVDENDGSCTDGDCSLRDAIATATAGYTIVFDSGLSGGVIDVSANDKLVVDKDLTISGTVPITISGNNLVRVFQIESSVQVNFFSLTIANGNSTVPDCLVWKYSLPCGGGMKVKSSSTVTVTEVVFVNNAAQLGGGIYVDHSQLNVHSSTFISNTGSSGGGIAVSYLSTAVVLDSTFIGNLVTEDGGAITNGNGNPLLVQNSLFANNTARFGGALSGGAFTEIIVRESTLRDNSAEYGGAINIGVTDSNLTIQNSTLSGNVANEGGAVYAGLDGKMTVVNSTISGNTAVGNDPAADGGGAISMGLWAATYAFTNTTIVSNTAPNVNGRDGLWLRDGTFKIHNSIVAYNGDTNCTVDAGIFDGDNSSIADDNSCAGFTVANPLLEPLADNGGGTLTHALGSESLAIDSGNNLVCPSTDQRGFPRPVDGDGDTIPVCDIGAYEAEPIPLTISKSGPTLVGAGDFITYTLTVANNLPLTVTDVVITDVIPLGATYISGGTQVGNIVSWTLPNLAGGAILNQQFVVTATTTITNDDYRVSASGDYSAAGGLVVVTIIQAPDLKVYLPAVLKPQMTWDFSQQKHYENQKP